MIYLEPLLMSPDGFGLATATPCQRAIARASDGVDLAELWQVEEVRLAFGGTKPTPGVVPDLIGIVAGIRGAKSVFTAAKAVQISQNVNIDHLSIGDEVRIPILAPSIDLAKVVFAHVLGNVINSKVLSQLIVDTPTEDSLMLRHPTGKPIEIKVTALSKYASTLVGRWLAAAIFDEAPRMGGSADSVRNITDSLTAIAGRMLGPVMLIGSPWAPFGPVYDLVQKHMGKPSKQAVIVRAKAHWLNPYYWTPERREKLKSEDPKAYQTDVEAEFADPEEALFPLQVIERCRRNSDVQIKPTPGKNYGAYIDPATRANAWTLVLVECNGLSVTNASKQSYRVALCKQWLGKPDAPLKPGEVFGEMAKLLKPYNVLDVYADQHAFDALSDLATISGINLIEHNWDLDNRIEGYTKLQTAMTEGRYEIPNDPYLTADLSGIRKRVTLNGYTIVLPRTGDGRHSDYGPPLAMSMLYPPEPPLPELPQHNRDDDHFQIEIEDDVFANAAATLLG